MNVISRGIRNAFRNGIRTFSIVIILGLSIGLALTMLLARQAVQAKIDSVKSSIGNQIMISPAGSRGFEGGGNPLTDAQLAKVKTTPHVVGLTETLSDRLDSTETNLQSSINPGTLGRRFGGGGGGFAGPAGGGDNGAATMSFTLPVSVTGTNNLSGSQALSGPAGGGGTLKITGGKSFDPTADADVALVGSALASKNNLKAGSTFQAYGATITVSGIFDAGNQFANSQLIMPLPTVQRLSGQPGDITAATARVDSITNLNSTVTAIQNQLGSSVADVVSEQDTAAQALAPLQNIKTISLVSLIGAVIAGSAIILLTMLMIVRERRREIGVLKAIGASSLSVMTQFVAESVTFTLIGAGVGLLIGVAGGNPVTQLLVVTSSTTGAMPGGGLGGGGGRFLRVAGGFGARSVRTISTVVGWDILLYGLGAALLIAIIGSAIPSLLIARIRPAEVMRTE